MDTSASCDYHSGRIVEVLITAKTMLTKMFTIDTDWKNKPSCMSNRSHFLSAKKLFLLELQRWYPSGPKMLSNTDGQMEVCTTWSGIPTLRRVFFKPSPRVLCKSRCSSYDVSSWRCSLTITSSPWKTAIKLRQSNSAKICKVLSVLLIRQHDCAEKVDCFNPFGHHCGSSTDIISGTKSLICCRRNSYFLWDQFSEIHKSKLRTIGSPLAGGIPHRRFPTPAMSQLHFPAFCGLQAKLFTLPRLWWDFPFKPRRITFPNLILPKYQGGFEGKPKMLQSNTTCKHVGHTLNSHCPLDSTMQHNASVFFWPCQTLSNCYDMVRHVILVKHWICAAASVQI